MYKFGAMVTWKNSPKRVLFFRAFGDDKAIIIEEGQYEGEIVTALLSDLTPGWQGDGEKVIVPEDTYHCPFFDRVLCSVTHTACAGIETADCPLPVIVRRK